LQRHNFSTDEVNYRANENTHRKYSKQTQTVRRNIKIQTVVLLKARLLPQVYKEHV
jgi:hypothetical protein